MCVAGSGGGTRYARLPPVIEVIPRWGYDTNLKTLFIKQANRNISNTLKAKPSINPFLKEVDPDLGQLVKIVGEI